MDIYKEIELKLKAIKLDAYIFFSKNNDRNNFIAYDKIKNKLSIIDKIKYSKINDFKNMIYEDNGKRKVCINNSVNIKIILDEYDDIQWIGITNFLKSNLNDNEINDLNNELEDFLGIQKKVL